MNEPVTVLTLRSGPRFRLRRWLLAAVALAAMPPPADAADTPVGHVTGIGGVFVKSKNPQALAAWYHTMLGMTLEPWGGAVFSNDAPLHPPKAAWIALPNDSTYTSPSTREIMLDFAVDNLDAVLARLSANGVKILKRDDTDPTGRFAWILDPDGTKIELWQPKRP